MKAKALFYAICITGIISLSGCGNLEPKNISMEVKEAKMTGIPEDIARIMGYASLASSSHNTQPWRVKIISNSEFIVQSDPARWLQKVDPENRELLLSIGSFWENLDQAARASGYEAKTEILAANPKDTDILKVKLIKAEPVNYNPDAMTGATAVRKPYDKKDLLSSQLDELKALLPSNHFVYFPKNSKEGEWIAKSLIDANRKQAFNDEKQKELSEWLRFSRFKVKKKGDGLTPEMLGLSGIAKFFWYTFMNKKSALSGSFRNKGIENVKNQVEGCAGFIIITSDDLSVSSLLRAGREFQRLTLKGTELKIGIHPMSQLMEESPWKEQIKGYLGLSEPVQFVLRAGYAKKWPKQGIRRDIKSFIVPE
ncbi:MAG: hypothetical protein GXP33_10505 [Spirochaetes bacterium]|nr:hypothetical protein [Spirochaetota bacterium]